MNFITHITMADLIYDEISAFYELSRVAFIYGNIMPDIDPRFNKNPHMFDNDFERIMSLSEELVSSDYSVKTYSVKLGFLCHYICDFFCLYHSEISKFVQYKKHGIYEIKLHFAFMKMLKSGLFTMADKDSDIGSMSRIRYKLITARKNYDEKPKSYENDLLCAIRTSIDVCMVITNAMVFKSGIEVYPWEDLRHDYI